MTNIQERLIALIQDKHIGIGAVANVAEAIAADARFNAWILACAKKQASEAQMIKLLERYDDLFEECLAVTRKFSENHDLSELMAGMDALVNNLTESTKLP